LDFEHGIIRGVRDGSILIVGGGTMGRGIASICSASGFRTLLFEADGDVRGRLRKDMESSWHRAVERSKLSHDAASQAASLLVILDALVLPPDLAVAIEAVPESLDLKQRIFRELDRLAPPEAVLASNTSSLSIAAIASATGRPAQVIGIHFFNPPAAMVLVEIVCGPETSPQTESRARELVAALGKTAIRVADSPGFATSRLGVALGLEAMRMVEEGIASAEDIDRAMELGYGHRMGPLKTSDLVGLDVRLSIADALAAGLDGARFTPPSILRRMVARGDLGKKTGRGFYRWEGDQAVAIAAARREEP
jgi:3-hydroxybutyryl-CoA dehydrogenase